MLSNFERRVLGHLGIPRNVQDVEHELRQDPHAPSLSSADVDGILRDEVSVPGRSDPLASFEERGWAVNLGTHSDLTALAASLEKTRGPYGPARVMPDDQADIYVKRLGSSRHSWRVQGDLWVITMEGVAALKAPGDDEPPAKTPSEVQAVVDAEWARVHHGSLDSGISGKLLEEEFAAWFRDVADDCERRWNERPVAPMAGGAGWTDTYENNLLDAENQKTALGAVVDPWFMALTILAFTDTDTGTTADDGTHKPTYTGYARKSVAGSDMNAASSGSATNANAIIFAACTSGSSTILGFGNCSASTVGTLRKYGTCSSTTVSTTQTPAQFAAAAYTTTAD